MSQYQKFMFDNFVIACEDENCAPVPAEEPEEEMADETAPLPVETVVAGEPETPPPASYSQDELDAAVRQAEERAYEKGFRAAASESEKQQTELLGELNGRIMTLLAEAEEYRRVAEQDSLHTALAAVRKLLPGLEKQTAETEIDAFLSANFANFRSQSALVFSFNPEVVSAAAEIIARLANKNDFEGKISIHKDSTLGISDCRVEWGEGGVERNTHKTLEKIEDLLDDKSSANKERDNG